MPAEVVPATGGILEEILDRTHPVWGEGLDRAAYAKYNAAQLRTPWGAGHITRVALVDGGRWVSTAKRYSLRARLRGKDVEVVGLGAVFTPPDLRRRGCAAELLRRVLSSAEAEGARLALLFSEIGPRYYERFGFRSLPITQLALDVRAAGARDHSTPGTAAAASVSFPGTPAIAMRSGEAGDLPALAEMNAFQAASFPFHLVRPPDYVGFAIAKKRLLAASSLPGLRQVEFFLVEEGGRAAAYVVVFESGDYWMVTECGDRDPSGARIGAILQAMLARHGSHPSRLTAWLPPGFMPPQLKVVWREKPAVVMMIAPLGGFDPGPGLSPQEICWWHADAF